MSTFKTQPIYGELIFGWLDVAHSGSELMSVSSVLAAVHWRFKGGKLGAYKMKYPTESSETTYPDGMSEDLALMSEFSPPRVALSVILRKRKAARKQTSRSVADWTASYSLMQSVKRQSDSHAPAITGMKAVYACLSYLWENCEAPSRSTAFAKMQTYTREAVLASSSASHLHVPAAEAAVKRTFSALALTRLAALRHTAAEFTRMMRASNSADARNAAVRHGRAILANPYEAYACEAAEIASSSHYVAGKRFYVSHGCAFLSVGEKTLALSRSDIARVHQFLTGCQSGLFATVSQACVAPGPERAMAVEIGRAYERQVSRILSCSKMIPAGDEVSLCKAYKRAFGAYLGELSGPLCAPETAELWDETRSTKHASFLELDAWVDELRRWSASTAFNLGKVYKLCPAPDACPGLTMIERHEMVCNHNAADPAMMLAFESELRSQVLRAYIRKKDVNLELRGARPTWWAAYKAHEFSKVPSDEIHQYLKWEGTAQMPVRSPDNPAIWKDSGLGWDSVDLAMEPEKPRRHGNMLTRMVFDSRIPMPGVRHFGHEHAHKVDIKPEGHKDPARGIYSGNLKDRLNQSWMEVAVQDVACEHPAFMVGADTELRDARVRAIVERPHSLDMVALYYSFDVSGWSPRMPPEPQHISHKVWGTLYDEQLFFNAHGITDGSTVYMNKNGYAGWFVNPGVNFEGYNGKEMTMILITLMSLTVKEWRRRIVEESMATEAEAMSWAAILLAYIDDGLAKLVLPRDRAALLFAIFKECTEHVFSLCGYTIEKSKCYPSDRFAVFLNEPYLAGRHVVHGTRAAMTICAENTEEHTSLIERLTAVSTGCRGAVMSGLDATAGVMLQAYHTYGHIEEWVRKPDPVLAAVWSFTPRAWGGLGLPVALQLGTSGGGSAMEESIRTLQRWARISTPAKLVFLRMVKQQMRERTPTGVLMAPLGGRAQDGVLVETRVPDAVRHALASLAKANELSTLARDFLNYSSPESLEAYANALVRLEPKHTYQEQMLSDLASAHPHAIFSSFARRIEKSSTLIQLVGHREMRRIIKANRADAQASYANMKFLMMI